MTHRKRIPALLARVAAVLVVGVLTAAAQDDGPVQTPPTTTHHARHNNSGDRIPAGSKIIVRINQELSSATAQSGQEWNGTLVNDIRDGDKVVAPQNASVTGIVTQAKSSGRLGGTALLALQVTRINGISVATDTISKDGAGHTKSNVAKIGGTAAAGAILGGLFGGGKGAAIGTLAGAGAGTAGAAASGKKEVVIAPETALTFSAQ